MSFKTIGITISVTVLLAMLSFEVHDYNSTLVTYRAQELYKQWQHCNQQLKEEELELAKLDALFEKYGSLDQRERSELMLMSDATQQLQTNTVSAYNTISKMHYNLIWKIKGLPKTLPTNYVKQ